MKKKLKKKKKKNPATTVKSPTEKMNTEIQPIKKVEKKIKFSDDDAKILAEAIKNILKSDEQKNK